MKLIPLLALLFLSSILTAQRKYNQDSASINYQLPDSVKATQLYASVSGLGKANAFYGVAFNKGKIGLQLRSKQKSFIFSMHTNGATVARGVSVDSVDRGTFRWKYNWQEGRNYQLLITTISDSASRSTIYTGYVFLLFLLFTLALYVYKRLTKNRITVKFFLTSIHMLFKFCSS